MSGLAGVPFDSVELSLGQGLAGFGELTVTDSPLNALCVMLHDEGADLDSLRWLALRLRATGISPLLLDLPGHGLSGGTVQDHLATTLASTHAIAESQGCAGVCFLAQGVTGHALLLTEQSAEAIAVVLVAPTANRDISRIQDDSWERVPKLTVTPTGDQASADFAEAITAATHAWCLRTTLTFDARADSLSEVAQTQIGSITAKFLLEQIAFANAARAQPAGSFRD